MHRLMQRWIGALLMGLVLASCARLTAPPDPAKLPGSPLAQPVPPPKSHEPPVTSPNPDAPLVPSVQQERVGERPEFQPALIYLGQGETGHVQAFALAPDFQREASLTPPEEIRGGAVTDDGLWLAYEVSLPGGGTRICLSSVEAGERSCWDTQSPISDIRWRPGSHQLFVRLGAKAFWLSPDTGAEPILAPGRDFSPDGKWVAQREGANFVVRSPDDPARTIDVGVGDFSRWINAETLLLTRGAPGHAWTVVRLNADGPTSLRVPPVDGTLLNLSGSPDGRWLAGLVRPKAQVLPQGEELARWGPLELQLFDVAAERWMSVRPDSEPWAVPAETLGRLDGWSADGRYLAVSLYGSESRILVYDVKEGRWLPSIQTPEAYGSEWGIWSKRGSWLAVPVQDEARGFGMLVQDVASGSTLVERWGNDGWWPPLWMSGEH